MRIKILRSISKQAFALISFCSVSLIAEEWISFTKDKEVKFSEIYVIYQNKDEIVVEANFYGFFVKNIKIKEETYQKIFIQSGGCTAEIGKPELPTLIRWFAVPQGYSIRISMYTLT
jgi:hypothetical protein